MPRTKAATGCWLKGKDYDKSEIQCSILKKSRNDDLNEIWGCAPWTLPKKDNLPLADHIDVILEHERKQFRAVDFFPELLNWFLFYSSHILFMLKSHIYMSKSFFWKCWGSTTVATALLLLLLLRILVSKCNFKQLDIRVCAILALFGFIRTQGYQNHMINLAVAHDKEQGAPDHQLLLVWHLQQPLLQRNSRKTRCPYIGGMVAQRECHLPLASV